MDWEENDLCIHNIFLHSGERAAGRIVDRTNRARRKQGMLYIVEGKVLFSQVGKEDRYAIANDIVIIPKGHCYSMEYVGEKTVFYLIDFEMITPQGIDYNLTKDIEIVLHGLSAKYLMDILKRLEACCRSEKKSDLFKCKEYVYRLVAELFHDERIAVLPTLPKYAIISKGVQMLQETYLENIPTEAFAKISNISVSSFRKLFTEYYGVSPIQYRNALRIKRAISLLKDGDMNVAEIATASGFANEGYFCRYYKKMTGETPSETRLKK